MATEDDAQRTRTIDLNTVAAMVHAGERQLCDEVWAQLQRLRVAGLDDGAVFVLPRDLFPMLTRIFDRPVVRSDVERPMIAIPAGA